MEEIQKKSKLVPGVAAYNITKYDERYVKPKQGQSNKAEKYSYIDEL